MHHVTTIKAPKVHRLKKKLFTCSNYLLGLSNFVLITPSLQEEAEQEASMVTTAGFDEVS